MADIRVPKLNNNDTEYLIVQWLVEDGMSVGAGDPVAVLETSKAADELEAEESGYLHHAAALNTWIAPGAVLARVTPEATPPLAFPEVPAPTAGSAATILAAPESTVPASTVPGTAVLGAAVPERAVPENTILDAAIPERTVSEAGVIGAAVPQGAVPESGTSKTAAPDIQPAVQPVVTDLARAAMEELGVSHDEVVALGLRVIRRSDVEALATRRTGAGHTGSPAGRPGAPVARSRRPVPHRRTHVPAITRTEAPAAAGDAAGTHRLSRVQRAVARAVTVSHDTIPAAYTLMKFEVGPLLERARGLTREVRRPVGLAELFVQAVAGLHPAFPLFFASIDGDVARPAEAPRVGVTFDMGEGLYVPVVHDTGSLRSIADTLMRYRLAATEGDFREKDLAGANIAVTLHTDADVILAIPFIFPGTVCALAITSPQQELVLGEDGAVTARTVANIGLAYDHRLINGRDASRFLTELRIELKS
ncbi:Pyruvate/2-oxoglutarate dehydrogenase complex, dihydrolipoamide acyltransferase (E2) component [Streptosporangium subroseum]|uniref:Dihydrolipoamide acetyltransferase component of pyruvate dehydrogenase complex n=1 Tax=Streptosporangium subroseum TaxID=106412 RepID=A0A239M9I3_9ACTN|nr:2-oxo acid dehydrogenase subunit E2 [Streptosporangium subroseum]SNT39627.1 Pyruvate/2-oxoglutarate dehydrogenase complex, dihydrolipoamide acyltransferase (E2) component [Streptosporangium subroseum]